MATPAVVNQLKQDAYLSGFAVRNVEIVGPQVGAQLRKQALLATLYSLAGMLVYLWFRFELIYGVAAVVAVFHDTLITVGAFSLFNKEISLTVIAAILTLVGYSMNDTIVVFDRIRENLRLTRREPLSDRGQSQHQPDAEPDGSYLGTDVPHGAVAVYLRRRGPARLLLRAGDRHSDRHLLVDRGGGADAGGLSGLAGEAWQGSSFAGGKAGSRLKPPYSSPIHELCDRTKHSPFLPAGMHQRKMKTKRPKSGTKYYRSGV